MKKRNFIITGLQSWDIPIGSNAVDITKEIAKENRVLYVNSPMDIMTMIKNKPTPENIHRRRVVKGIEKPIRHITKNLWVLDFPFTIWSVNKLPDGKLFDTVNRINNQKIFRYIKMTADELGFDDVIHFIDNDIYRSFYSKELLKPALSVYYRRDNLQPMPYWRRHIPRLEPQLIEKSDLVICDSLQYADFSRPFNPQTVAVGHGVDLSSYDPDVPREVPQIMAGIPGPRIGYIGDINSLRLDPDLIYEVAKSKPGYSFIMIGGEDAVFAAHPLHQLKNVHFLGSVPKTDVAEYMAAMDVCLNPQQVNAITIGNLPRKIHEYLAMGKPIVATRTRAMEVFEKYVFLCKNADEYKVAVENAIADNTPDRNRLRIEYAQSHSWESNVQLILKHITEALN